MRAGDREGRWTHRDISLLLAKLETQRLFESVRRAVIQSSPWPTPTSMRTTHSELGEVIAEVRTIAHGIHPASLAEGLDSAVEFLADDAPLRVDSDLAAGALPDGVALTAYIAAEEALANAAAAGATEVKIDVRREEDAIQVTVIDDGPGGAAPIPGGGLETLRDRACALEGELTLQSPPGGPTRLTLRLPA